VLTSSCLAVQFLLGRTTVSTDACPAVDAVYSDDVPHEPHHIRCWQHTRFKLN